MVFDVTPAGNKVGWNHSSGLSGGGWGREEKAPRQVGDGIEGTQRPPVGWGWFWVDVVPADFFCWKFQGP